MPSMHYLTQPLSTPLSQTLTPEKTPRNAPKPNLRQNFVAQQNAPAKTPMQDSTFQYPPQVPEEMRRKLAHYSDEFKREYVEKNITNPQNITNTQNQPQLQPQTMQKPPQMRNASQMPQGPVIPPNQLPPGANMLPFRLFQQRWPNQLPENVQTWDMLGMFLKQNPQHPLASCMPELQGMRSLQQKHWQEELARQRAAMDGQETQPQPPPPQGPMRDAQSQMHPMMQHGDILHIVRGLLQIRDATAEEIQRWRNAAGNQHRNQTDEQINNFIKQQLAKKLQERDPMTYEKLIQHMQISKNNPPSTDQPTANTGLPGREAMLRARAAQAQAQAQAQAAQRGVKRPSPEELPEPKPKPAQREHWSNEKIEGKWQGFLKDARENPEHFPPFQMSEAEKQQAAEVFAMLARLAQRVASDIKIYFAQSHDEEAVKTALSQVSDSCL